MWYPPPVVDLLLLFLSWLQRHWTQESGACRLPGYGQVPVDVAHLLSGECTALQPYLATTLHHLLAMLAPQPHLKLPVSK